MFLLRVHFEIMSDQRIAENLAEIRLEKDDGRVTEVPFEVLAATLKGFQALVYAIVQAHNTNDPDQCEDISDSIKKKYALHAQIPQKGSYIIPLSLKSIDLGIKIKDFSDPIEISYQNVLDKLADLLKCVVNQKSDELLNLVKTHKLMRKVAWNIRAFALQQFDEKYSQDIWHTKFKLKDKDEIILHPSTLITFLREVIEAKNLARERDFLSVIGKLSNFYLERKEVEISFLRTRKLRCSYHPEQEKSIGTNLNDFFQVSGEFSLDRNACPVALLKFERLELIDPSVIELDKFVWSGRSFTFSYPLILEPKIDESSQLITATDPSIGLLTFAENREDLIEEIKEQLAFMWDAYVMSQEEDLAPDALRLREKLKQLMSEVQ